MRNDEGARVKMTGVAGGVLFIICFFSMSLVRGCSGGDIIRLSLNSRDQNENVLGGLLIAVVICAGVGSVLYGLDRIREGALAGKVAIIGSIIAMIVQKVHPKYLGPGAWLSLVSLCGLAFAPWLRRVTSAGEDRDLRRCSSCGALIRNEDSRVAPGEALRGDNAWRAKNEKDQDRCSECGGALSSVLDENLICPSCGNMTAADGQFCESCGAALRRGA